MQQEGRSLERELEYPDASYLMLALQNELRWFDYWLKGIDNGIMDEPAVEYYLMASARKNAASEKNGWRTAENWPLETEELRLYLTADGTLSQEPPSAPDGVTTYAFDPEEPVPTLGGANLTLPIGHRQRVREGTQARPARHFEQLPALRGQPWHWGSPGQGKRCDEEGPATPCTRARPIPLPWCYPC